MSNKNIITVKISQELKSEIDYFLEHESSKCGDFAKVSRHAALIKFIQDGLKRWREKNVNRA